MSKYVKEMMMDQIRNDLGEARSVLVLDLKGLDAVAETQLRSDLRKKKIHLKAVKNTLAGKIFDELGMGGVRKYLSGPSVIAWGGAGVAELAKELSGLVKKLKKPEIKGGIVDGTVIGPNQVDDITRLPSREVLIGRVVALALSPVQRVVALANAPGAGLAGQIKAIAEKDQDGAAPDAEAAPDGEPTPDAA